MSNIVQKREWLAAGEVTHLLRVNPATVYRAVERGELPAFRLGPRGHIHIPADAVKPEPRR